MDWNEILTQTDVDVANSLLEEKIILILNSEAPMRTSQVQTRYNKYLSVQTKSLMEERDRLREIARRTQTGEDWAVFRTHRNLCTREQRKDKSNYLKAAYDKIECENDSGRLFSMTRNTLGWNRSPPPTMFRKDGKLIRKQKDLANIQAHYYKNKVDKIKNSSLREKSCSEMETQYTDSYISPQRSYHS